MLKDRKILIPVLLVAIIGLGLTYVLAQSQTSGSYTQTSNTQPTTNTTCICECNAMKAMIRIKEQHEEQYGEHKMEKGWKGISKISFNLTTTTYTGTVVFKSSTSMRLTLSVDNVNYTVLILPVYVRSSDGALVSGLWIFNKISPGTTLEITSLANKTVLPALSISINGETYITPMYYHYSTFKG
ncbi:MAG: hypothetical protein QW366_01015 [Sulfolobales archaeon]